MGDDRSLVMSYLLMRKIVGAIGVLLPFALIVGNVLIGRGVESSISTYYYTPLRTVFVGSLWALGVFLISYRGYDIGDEVITDLAGIGAVGVSLCPIPPAHATATQATIGDFHFGFAGLAFAMLALMSLRFAKQVPTPKGLPMGRRIAYALGFTPPGAPPTPLAKLVAFRVSGVVIVICVILFAPLSNPDSKSLLILETIMLVAFGVAWFLKGTTLPGEDRKTGHLRAN